MTFMTFISNLEQWLLRTTTCNASGSVIPPACCQVFYFAVYPQKLWLLSAPHHGTADVFEGRRPFLLNRL